MRLTPFSSEEHARAEAARDALAVAFAEAGMPRALRRSFARCLSRGTGQAWVSRVRPAVVWLSNTGNTFKAERHVEAHGVSLRDVVWLQDRLRYAGEAARRENVSHWLDVNWYRPEDEGKTWLTHVPPIASATQQWEQPDPSQQRRAKSPPCKASRPLAEPVVARAPGVLAVA